MPDQSSQPKISVVIPAYKTSKMLGRCLESIRNQTLEGIEVIVVDDCSPEDEKSVVESYQDKGLDITYVRHEQNQSQYMARQTGGKLATGEYIAHLDADDITFPTMYEKLYNKAKTANADIAQCLSLMGNNVESPLENKKVMFAIPKLDFFSGGPGELFKCFFVDWLTGWLLWHKICRLDIWQRAQKHLPSHHISQVDDILPSFFMFYEARSFVAVDEPLHLWIRHEGAISNAKPSIEKANVFIENSDFCIRVMREFLIKNDLWHTPYVDALEGMEGWFGKVCGFGFQHTLSKLSADKLNKVLAFECGNSPVPYFCYGAYNKLKQMENTLGGCRERNQTLMENNRNFRERNQTLMEHNRNFRERNQSLKQQYRASQKKCQQIKGQYNDQHQCLIRLQQEHNALKKGYDEMQNSTRFKLATRVANIVKYIAIWRLFSKKVAPEN